MSVAPVTDNFYTTVRNTCGSTRFFGFLPPHGKTLTAGQEVTILGNIQDYLNNNRKRTAFATAITTGAIVVVTGSSQSQVILGAVDDGTDIVKGDLVFLDTDDIKSAADFTWTSDLATTQANFSEVFLGVALASHADGDGAIINFPVDISPEAIWSFPCTSEAHEIGSTLGPKKASGNALVAQALVKAIPGCSIARTAVRDASAATTVRVRLQSAYDGYNLAGSEGVDN